MFSFENLQVMGLIMKPLNEHWKCKA